MQEVEEILELLKSTWRILGITETIHHTGYAWVLFRQVITNHKLVYYSNFKSYKFKFFFFLLFAVCESKIAGNNVLYLIKVLFLIICLF